ncbi:degenerin mec-10-like [Branchiostoma floridae]|uniref:Degenerin mec-10-like n=1 Tax=Branchiostoma floridae TaxID=7739 RepID=A0A9J7L1F1_BRAFL|nr:degenerin mec-10-like [Branchiostoma floridae]
MTFSFPVSNRVYHLACSFCRYGNCYTFNSGTNGVVRTTTRSGTSYGLKLTLNAESAEYLGLFGQRVGARVTLHPVNSTAFPDTEGIDAPPGTASSISVRQVVITRTPWPYGQMDCTNNNDDYMSLYSGKIYTLRMCENTCLQCAIINRCHCATDMIDLTRKKAIRECSPLFANSTVPVCNIAKSRVQACVRGLWKRFQRGELECKCDQACKDEIFELSLSSSLWPSDRFVPYILRDLHMIQDIRRNNLPRSMQEVRDNLVRVEISYKELNYESIAEEWNYKEENLLGDMGGLLGFYIGVSIITICEFVDYVLDLLGLLCRKIKRSIKRR